MRTALTIAGSDSGGGAGIQADLRTFWAHGVFGTSAITAVTAQNTTGVTAVHPVPPEIVAAQIDAVVSDLGADAVKVGMLATPAIAAAAADRLRRYRPPLVVVDPVMVAKGGAALLAPEAVTVLRLELLPLATLVTANLPEAAALTGRPVATLADMRQAVRALVDLGAAAAVVKGGHLDGPPTDVFWDGTTLMELPEARIATRHTHGTGCTFAAAITARLARGEALPDAVRAAKAYVAHAIRHAPGLGAGHGPLGPGAPV